ncbi:fatty acid desaturase [Paraburkholderia caballeronis]|nr:fatty acid desaturase [Paraburkholderia caballeronis]TDV05568.1 fatty acid desaturase [Paraburkholderia caballeronis]TDV15339.1 fatty acid desaturase [Paraburkholderia caballeronis]
MCDHFALRPGGVYSFTRDTVIPRCWRGFIHPHNNGYHLSHHLVPKVPYYRLPEAQKLLSRLPSYAQKAVVCESYFSGISAVVRQRSHAMETN